MVILPTFHVGIQGSIPRGTGMLGSVSKSQSQSPIQGAKWYQRMLGGLDTPVCDCMRATYVPDHLKVMVHTKVQRVPCWDVKSDDCNIFYIVFSPNINVTNVDFNPDMFLGHLP